jgi:hypothetical protein
MVLPRRHSSGDGFVGAILMTVLVIVVLAVAVVDSRDRVRRDALVTDSSLREWYESRYGRKGATLSRTNVEAAIHRAQLWRRWGPLLLSACTMGTALFLTFAAASSISGMDQVLRSPLQVLEAVDTEVLVQTAIVYLLLPFLVIEGVLAVLYVADFDIGRLQRLLQSLN